MRILIIGGTGLISAEIVRLLVARGDEVVLYNRGFSKRRPAPEAKVIIGNRTCYAAFEEQMESAGRFDIVIDMVGYDVGDGPSVIRAFGGKVAQFIFCSTVDVYSKPASRYPVTEAEAYGGLNDYSRKKIGLEKTLFKACQEGVLPLTVIRPAYTYGDGRMPLHPISWGRYFHRLHAGKPIIVHGDGQSLWSCNHAADVARVFVAACGNPSALGQAYHVSGEEWLTWNQYHEQAAAALGLSRPRLIHIPSDVLSLMGVPSCAENFQFNNIFDNAKAKDTLGYQYTVSWMEGVRGMARWYEQNPEHPVVDDKNDPDDEIIARWEKAVGALSARIPAALPPA